MKPEYKFYQDEIVTFNYNQVIGVGKIVGVATIEMPVLGRLWIVEMVECSQVPNDTYPFNTISIPESFIFKA